MQKICTYEYYQAPVENRIFSFIQYILNLHLLYNFFELNLIRFGINRLTDRLVFKLKFKIIITAREKYL